MQPAFKGLSGTYWGWDVTTRRMLITAHKYSKAIANQLFHVVLLTHHYATDNMTTISSLLPRTVDIRNRNNNTK